MDLPMNGDEPLVLADGTKIDCDSGKVIKDRPARFVSIPNPSDAQRLVARTRKSVAELPLPPEKLSGVALVAFYTLYGLNDRDISIAVEGRLSVEQIENIRKLEAYSDFIQSAKDTLLHTETTIVREIFEQHAPKAAEKIVELAESDNDVMALTASKDILDRAGHRPADIVEHRHKMEDSLNIVITRRDEATENEIPMIDITPEHVTVGNA